MKAASTGRPEMSFVSPNPTGSTPDTAKGSIKSELDHRVTLMGILSVTATQRMRPVRNPALGAVEKR